MDITNIKVAIVHYWFLDIPRGGEKVVTAFCELFPQADIFTHIFQRKAFSHLTAKHHIITSFINRLPFAQSSAMYYLPFMPIASEQFDFNGYDLVISSESGPAKGIIVPENCVHLCYCHSPMRYIWNKYPEQVRWSPSVLSWPMRLSAHYLRLVDYASAARVDQFIANSNAVARRIEKYYRRPSRVIFPPVDVSAFAQTEEVEDYYLYCGQLTAYKRPDLAIDCFNRLGLPLRVIGDGEMMSGLKKSAKSNIQFLGRVTDKLVRHNLARCRALVFPGEEDFGMVPVEAMASGRPVIAYGRGGALDTVLDEITGIFFHEPTADSLAGAVQRFQTMKNRFDSQVIAQHARNFDKQVFFEHMTEVVQEALTDRLCSRPT